MEKTFRRGSDNNNFRKIKRDEINKSKKLKKFFDKHKVTTLKPTETDESDIDKNG